MKFTDVIHWLKVFQLVLFLKSYVISYLTMCKVNYCISYQHIQMVITKVCKSEIDFTKISSNTAVIQYILNF